LKKGEGNVSEIVLARIDARLIHGQIYAMWCAGTKADVIAVADDDTAASSFQQSLMDMAVPAGVKTVYVSLPEAKEVLEDLKEERIFLITASPENLLTLLENGLTVSECVIGNMPMASGKRQITPAVAVDENDIHALKRIRDYGCTVSIRKLPGDIGEDISLLLEEEV